MRLDECLLNPPTATGYAVAYSGGLDSTVLLHLAQARGFPGLNAIHVHHGLQAAADDWAAQAEQQCRQWGVPLRVLRVAVEAQHPQGPEAAAREARYAALCSVLQPGTLLMSAHHADDQAETVLLRLFRGTGVQGLAAMRPLAFLGAQPLWRPLLKQPREALQAYAGAQGLRWIEDPHNQHPRYARSWLRSTALPLLRSRWPQLDVALLRTAEHASDAAQLLQDLARDLLATVCLPEGGLSVAGLLALSAPQRRLVLRHWLVTLGLPSVASAVLQRLEREVLAAAPEAHPLLCWPGGEFRRYRQALHAGQPMPTLRENLCLDWDGQQPLVLPEGLGLMHCAVPQAMQICFGLPGVRIKPAGQAHHRTLRQLCQQAGVPPWWRSRLPIIFVNRTVVSIAAHWNTADAPALRWQVQPRLGLPATLAD